MRSKTEARNPGGGQYTAWYLFETNELLRFSPYVKISQNCALQQTRLLEGLSCPVVFLGVDCAGYHVPGSGVCPGHIRTTLGSELDCQRCTQSRVHHSVSAVRIHRTLCRHHLCIHPNLARFVPEVFGSSSINAVSIKPPRYALFRIFPPASKKPLILEKYLLKQKNIRFNYFIKILSNCLCSCFDHFQQTIVLILGSVGVLGTVEAVRTVTEHSIDIKRIHYIRYYSVSIRTYA